MMPESSPFPPQLPPLELAAMAPPAQFFVYGTLQRGQCRESCWPVAPVEVREAFVRGRLYDLGPYPALTAGDDWVRGELWRLPPDGLPKTLATLDEIEGYRAADPSSRRVPNLYERLAVRVYGAPREEAAMGDLAQAYFRNLERLPKSARYVAPIAAGGSRYAHWPVTAGPSARRIP